MPAAKRRGGRYTRRPVNVLGIESSCDETGLALVSLPLEGEPRLLAHALHSQIDMHQAYGGVVPELASRDHIRRVAASWRRGRIDVEPGCLTAMDQRDRISGRLIEPGQFFLAQRLRGQGVTEQGQ